MKKALRSINSGWIMFSKWILSSTRNLTGKFLICFYIFLLSYIFHFPEVDVILKGGGEAGLNQQIENPFQPTESDVVSHAAKTELRLFLPLLGKLTGLDYIGLGALVRMLAFPFYFFAFVLFRRLLKDRLSAFLLTGALAFCFFGKAFGFHFYKDAYSHFLLVICAFFPASIWQYILMVITGFMDERAIVAIVIFPLLNAMLKVPRIQGLTIAAIVKHSIVPALALVTVIGLRFYLTFRFGLDTPVGEGTGISLNTWRASFTLTPLALLNAFDGFWILILLGSMYLVLSRKCLIWLYIVGYMSVLTGIAFIVVDWTKSLGYLILIPFIFSYFFSELPTKQIRVISLSVILMSLLIPNYYIWGGEVGEVYWMSPIIPKVFKFFF